MGQARFSLQILLVAALIVLCFTNGFARTLLERGESGDHSSAQVEEEEKVGKARMLIQLMDYDEPGPNNNPRTGYLFTPPPPPQG